MKNYFKNIFQKIALGLNTYLWNIFVYVDRIDSLFDY